MILLKRMALAVMLSCFSEGAIAQQHSADSQPRHDAHSEPWWNSKYGEADTLGAVNNLSAERRQGRGQAGEDRQGLCAGRTDRAGDAGLWPPHDHRRAHAGAGL